MKKQVRIRKALPGETPGYYNKTAKFLKKAAMGMEVSSPSMDPARINQIYENVYVSLKNDAAPELLYNQLINEYALDESTSVMLIKSALSKLAQEGYVDPDLEEEEEASNQQQGAQEQPQQDPQQRSNEDAERASSDAEQEDLAMSDEGYYDEEEAANNSNTHLETEQDEEEQAFRYGGYFADGGAEEVDEYQDQDPNQQMGREEAVMGQFDNPGNGQPKKPFSIEDLIAVTPGMQNQEAFPDLSYYVGDYKGSADSYQPEEYLPQAADGGISKLASFLPKLPPNPLTSLIPMTNLSTARKWVPGFSALGQGMTKIPYLGAKFAPKLATPFTQNRTELWNVLNGATPKLGTFSQNGTLLGGADGSLQADRLLLYQDDVKNIIQNIENGQTSFKLADINPLAQEDGLVSGIYPLDAKIVAGTDDAGNNFFELKHTFGPNQKLPFGTTPSKAKEITFKNRFYFNNDPTTGELKVFDPLGNPLMNGVQTKTQVTRPIGSTATSFLGDKFLRDNGNTPFPNYNTGASDQSQMRGIDITGVPPTTWGDLSTRGKIGRTLETYGTTGLNQFFRTGSKGVEKVDYPVYGYANMALGPNIQNPAGIPYSQTASDIKNAINYKYRLGLKTSLIGGGLGYLGYKGYDAYANPCQCDDTNAPNFMPKDAFGNCPCGTDVGPSKVLDPNAIEQEGTVDPSLLERPDSVKFLKEQTPSEYNYYRYQDSNIVNPNMQNEVLPDDFKKGGASKNRFIKRMASMYAEGGPSTEGTLGQGKRSDTLTDDISNTKTSFLNTLKNNSNKAVSKEIYENAQGNPKILNMLMKDGYKENLSDDAFDTNELDRDPTAAFGGFIDMDAAEPLTKFVYGGDEEEYYEPYGLTQARDGINILNHAGEFRTVADELPFDEWAEGEKEDWQTENPGEDFEAWKADPSRKEDYDKYLDFHSNAVKDFANYGDDEEEEEGTNGNCPAGYTWNGIMCVLKTSASLNPKETNCGPGMVYSKTYKTCIPVSKINYVPRTVRAHGNLRNTLLPWNPLVSNAGSWVKQKGTPYYLNDGRSYNGLIPDKPMASYTTKKGLLGGRKKWIDIYEVDGDGTGTGVPMQDLGKLEEMLNHKKGQGSRNNSNDFRLTKKVVKDALEDGWIKNYNDKDSKPERVSRRDELEKNAKERYGYNDQDWESEGKRNQRQLRQAERYEEGRGARYRTNQAYESVKGAAGKIKDTYDKYNNFMDKVKHPFRKRDGGAFELGTGFGMGVGQNSSAYNPYSQQSQFENNMFGTGAPNKAPQQQNPFAFINGTGTGSYAETANTGHTLGDQGQEIIPQETQSPKEKQYVGVERKRKNAYSFDGEAAVNVGNATAKGVLGAWNRMQQSPIEYNQTLNAVDPMNNYAMANEVDTGDWQDFGSKSGAYRYDQEGQDRSSRATFGSNANTNARYGGYMQDGGYTDDDEVYMTPEELEQFLAAGGQVEYL